MLNTINSDSINRLIEANKNDTVFAYLESIINNRT